MKTLFTAQTANAASSVVEWSGGPGVFIVTGTFDTASIVLELSADGTNYTSGTSGTLTAEGAVSFSVGPCLLKATLSSVGASTSINAHII